MKKLEMNEALHLIEVMLRRRLKEKGKEATDQWVKEKALEIYDESASEGEYIRQLEADEGIQ